MQVGIRAGGGGRVALRLVWQLLGDAMIPNLDSTDFDLSVALYAAQACAASYQFGLPGDGSDWRATLGLGDDANAELYGVSDYAYLLADLGAVQLIAFRGTQNLSNWLTDGSIVQVSDPVYAGQIHAGFARADDVIWTDLQPRLLPKAALVTGHSLGGALATLTAARLMGEPYRLHTEQPVKACYTFGSPRVGDHGFAASYEGLMTGGSYRVVNGADVVPAVPLPVMLVGLKLYFYEHVGLLAHFSKDGRKMMMASLPRPEVMLAGVSDVKQIAMFDDHQIEAYIATLEKAQGVTP
jgi:triacylglycerol lipase